MGKLNETTTTTIDKSMWRAGEWKNEPDNIEWSVIINNYEYKCAIIRGVFGNLCGYVIVKENHDALKHNLDDLNIHG